MREVHGHRIPLPTREPGHVWPYTFVTICRTVLTILIARDHYIVAPMPEHVVRMMKTDNLEDEHLEDESEENTDPMDNLGHTLTSAPVHPANKVDYALSRMEPVEDDPPSPNSSQQRR
jgi:hypothetical protein